MKMNLNRLCLAFASWWLSFSCSTAPAEVRLPALFSDHMVLQSGKTLQIWGRADPSEKVEVEIEAQKKSVITDEQGKWKVQLEPLNSGLRTVLTISGKNKLVLRDVVVGEVWLGSGQSNMGMQVNRVDHFEEEQAAANFPEIRMFTVASKTSTNALEECAGSWRVCNSNTVSNFSAVLYFFGRELHQNLHTPVGLIHSSWGGTPIQAWLQEDLVKSSPGYPAFLQHKKQEIADWPERHKKNLVDLESWEKAVVAAKAAHRPEPLKPGQPAYPESGQYMPGQLYNAMIHPLIRFPIRGVLWYQGESNAGGGAAGAIDYTELQIRLISSWRQDWGVSNLYFLYAQLPNFNYPGDRNSNSWAFFREGQARVLSIPDAGMAVTIDIGEAGNIHPKNKQEAGRRLALLALGKVYQQKVIFQGPKFAGFEVVGAELKLNFQQTNGGLVAHDGALPGFVIAGEDKLWKPAEARIEGDSVMVFSREVPQPVAVRYGWANNPDCKLFDRAGFPVMPFRTDHWP